MLGEHVELHMFIGSMQKGVSMDGYVDNNLLEARSIRVRHAELVEEMEARGYKHKSTLFDSNSWKGQLSTRVFHHRIDRDAARTELHRRCPECLTLWEAKQ